MERSKSTLDSKDISMSISKNESKTPLRVSKKMLQTLTIEEWKKVNKWNLLLINKEGEKINGDVLPQDKDLVFPELKRN